jgi:hypothetical protein
MKLHEAAEFFISIPEEDDDLEGRLFECVICGALVRDCSTVRHTEWHQQVIARTTREEA